MKYYSIPEAAQLLGRTRQDIWYLVKKNKIQSTKIGRLYAIKEEDLKTYFINKIQHSTEPQSQTIK